MVDALLVFSPLQEDSFFVLRSPHLDQMGVTPLLRRRLFGLHRRCFSLNESPLCLCWFSKHASSPRLHLCDLTRSPCGSRFTSLTDPLAFALRLLRCFLSRLLTLCRCVPTVRVFGLIRVLIRISPPQNRFGRRLLLFCFSFTKN